MGDVDAFRIQGLKCYFGSNDHPPRHFEVLKRGKWVIRVYIVKSSKSLGLSWDTKKSWRKASPTARELGQILEMVLAHKKRLLKEWDTKVCVVRDEARLAAGDRVYEGDRSHDR